MKRAGKTQKEAARAIGITEKAMSMKANGERAFTDREILAFCRAAGLTDPRPVFFPELIT